MKDLFKREGLLMLGPGGIKCHCCDEGMSHKRKSKLNRNMFSKLKRTRLKRKLREECT